MLFTVGQIKVADASQPLRTMYQGVAAFNLSVLLRISTLCRIEELSRRLEIWDGMQQRMQQRVRL